MLTSIDIDIEFNVEVPIVVVTCDKYQYSLKGFSHLLERYWPDHGPVTVFGFSVFDFVLEQGYEFLHLGKQEDYPADKWSNALYKGLCGLPYNHFVLMLEDYWLTRPVDNVGVGLLYTYMQEYPDILRIDLTDDRLHSKDKQFIEDIESLYWYDLFESDLETQYNVSFQPGLWNRDLLRDRVLKMNESPWDTEIYGTSRLRGFSDIRVLGTRNRLIRIANVHHGGSPELVNLDQLDEDDLAELVERGYV